MTDGLMVTVGNGVLVSGTFTDRDSLDFDPDTITINIVKPDHTLDVYTYGTDPDLTRVSEGNYERVIVTSAPTGRWWWYMVGTGDKPQVKQGSFYVKPLPS